ncbi:hypothetical protein Raf01_56430 [Rugosimonospora africana]|uniref:Tetratricopeptide repeat-containing protein n=2 Tax=Rugosimonospora africana TaxID=556532 RepID=A0A8J3VTB1_9ACTN|nr:hypothetical protein Raf01_56430 [Rugosimonospora africana]
MPAHIRLVVALVAIAGWVLGYLLVKFLSTGLLTDPSWRRPSRKLAAGRGRRRREYVIPTEVPPPPGVLIGRDEQVRTICEHLMRPAGDGPSVVVLTGPTGVGKSALAIGIAQVLADRYRDGQLLARLDRAAPGQQGVDDVLRTFVTALQEQGDAMPATGPELVRRYRELTASRRVLVILESARDPEQVRPLLPRGRGCGAILTSWHTLALDPSWLPVPIDRLSDESALRVLDALVGNGRVEAEAADALRIAEATAGHPFALQVAGAALASRRNWTLKVAVQRMSEARLVPAVGQTLPAYSAALDLSYALLTEQERRGLLMLGLIEEPTFAPWMLGALLRGAERAVRDGGLPAAPNGAVSPGADPDGDSDPGVDATAERILDRLVYARLVERRLDDATGVATFRIAGHIESYLKTRLFAEVPVEARQGAVDELSHARRLHGERSPERLLRYQVYQQLHDGDLSTALNTARAVLKLCRERVETAGEAVKAGSAMKASDVVDSLAAVSSRDEWERAKAEEGLALAALAEVNGELGWLEDSRRYATAARETETKPCRPRALRCLALVNARTGRLDEAQRLLDEAVVAADQLTDRWEVVRTKRDLALVQAQRGLHDRARETILDAVTTCSSSDDPARHRLPAVLWAQGTVLAATGDWDEADRVLDRAETLFAGPGPHQRLWLPWIRHQRALVALEQRRYGRAREHALRASQAFRDMNHRYGIAHCRMTIGRAYLDEGNEPAATPILEEAVQTFGGCGDRWIEAECRTWLGEAHLSAGRLKPAAEAFARAAQDFHDLGDTRSRGRARARLSVADARRRREAVEDNPLLRVARPLVVGMRVRAD